MNPPPTLHKYPLMTEFVGEIRNYRSNTIEVTRLAIESRRHFFAIAECKSIEFALEVGRGILHVYHDKSTG